MAKNTVSVSVNRQRTNALCDTGANVSCVSKSFYEKVSKIAKPKSLNQYISITGVGGTTHPVTGKILLDISFGSLIISHGFLVVEDLHHSLILGHDFLETNKVTIDVASKQMTIQDIKVCSLKTDTGFARTIRQTNIRANSEVVIPIKIARFKSGNEVLLEPLQNLAKQNIIGAKCLVKIRNGKAMLRVVNPTNRDICLKGNKILATVSQFKSDSVCSFDGTEHTKQKYTSNKKYSFDLSNSNLNEEQKTKLLKMLNENSDIFSEGMHDIGKTDLQVHEIDTGNAKPVRTPFYKQTPDKRRVLDSMLSEMKDNGILKESNSEWYSPVVLVRKSDTDNTGEYRFAVDYRKLNKVTKPYCISTSEIVRHVRCNR